MRLVRRVKEMQSISRRLHEEKKRVGFVPTMGSLHDGHLSLIRLARKMCDTLVVSVFVNPTQFGPSEDFTRYPRDIERDKKLCESEGTDILFAPETDDMYPEDFSTYVVEERLSLPLCGRSRPTHFRGVTTVVTKLFNIIRPTFAVFGQKDAQQAFVIERMVRDLNFDIEIVVAPIVREKDGLAMSSRNRYLSPKEREEATAIFRSLSGVKQMVRKGERKTSPLIKLIRDEIARTETGRLDYAEIVDTRTLSPVEVIEDDVLVAVAAQFGRARLIDNIIIKKDEL